MQREQRISFFMPSQQKMTKLMMAILSINSSALGLANVDVVKCSP